MEVGADRDSRKTYLPSLPLSGKGKNTFLIFFIELIQSGDLDPSAVVSRGNSRFSINFVPDSSARNCVSASKGFQFFGPPKCIYLISAVW